MLNITEAEVCKTYFLSLSFLGWLVIGPSTAGNILLILFCGFVHGSNLTSNR